MTIAVKSLDGTTLAADVTVPPDATRGIVLVHGGGVDRHEGGFFDRLADGLARDGVASMQVDLRGHGGSGGRQEDLTLAGVGNDVRAAVADLTARLPSRRISVLGASFSGGVCASVAARHPDLVDRLVLINPLLDYKKRFIDDKDYWSDDHIDQDAGDRLARDHYVAHSPTFKLGTALLNEVFWWDSRAELARVAAPTLIVHGTRDTFIPIESSRAAIKNLAGGSRLVELDGAQHGIAVHDDPRYEDPRTRQWQSDVISLVSRWLTG